jgi:hypothetical protein
MTRPAFIEPGWTLAVAATNRPDLRILFYPDGTRRFWHTCTVPPAPDVIAELATIECAPTLQHDITTGRDADDELTVTVSPSILCLRCRIHGFFQANQWRDA